MSLKVKSSDGSLSLDDLCDLAGLKSLLEHALLEFWLAKLDVQSIFTGESLIIRFKIFLLDSSLLKSSLVFSPLNFPVVLATKNCTSDSI